MAVIRIFILSLVCIFGSQTAIAEPLRTLIRQPRTMAMGGAGVGLADDEYALFQNPAGLAGSDHRRFKLLGLGVEASWDTYEVFGTSIDALRNFTTDDLNMLMGKNIAMRAGATPMIQLPGFELAYVVDAQGSIEQFNQANPYFDLTDMITHGLQAGFGWSLQHGRHPHDEWRIGVAGKVLWRRGGHYQVSTTGFLNATNDSKAYIDNLVGGYGVGFGADAGIQYVNHLDRKTSVSFGASVTDIADTKFSDSHAARIPMNVSLGVGYQKAFDFLKFKLAADLRNLNANTGFSNKTHVGVDVGIPLFDFYVGANQLNPTFGVAFDLWIVRVSLVSFAEELGVLYHQNTSRMTMLQVDLNLPI